MLKIYINIFKYIQKGRETERGNGGKKGRRGKKIIQLWKNVKI